MPARIATCTGREKGSVPFSRVWPILSIMKSKLADSARRALLADLRRMTAEQRLAAYVTHCQLIAQLYLAGRASRRRRAAGSPNAD